MGAATLHKSSLVCIYLQHWASRYTFEYHTFHNGTTDSRHLNLHVLQLIATNIKLTAWVHETRILVGYSIITKNVIAMVYSISNSNRVFHVSLGLSTWKGCWIRAKSYIVIHTHGVFTQKVLFIWKTYWKFHLSQYLAKWCFSYHGTNIYAYNKKINIPKNYKHELEESKS